MTCYEVIEQQSTIIHEQAEIIRKLSEQLIQLGAVSEEEAAAYGARKE